MRGLRGEVLDWFDAGRIAPGKAAPVLRAAGILPTRAEWRGFLGQLTLWLGTVALAAAVIFFFAYNWDDLGRYAKFGLVEAAILAGLAACWRIGLDSTAGKAVLLLLSLLTGALLALTGQVYQTGADTFELFTWWAMLILPWVLLGRFSPLWLVWLGLLNLAGYFYFGIQWDGEGLLWTLFALNTIALAAWEVAHRFGVDWLRDNWPPRLVALGSGVFATGLMIGAIFSRFDSEAALEMLAYVVWIGALYGWYRLVRVDLFMLAGGVLSLIVTVASFLSDLMLDNEPAGGFLFIGLVVIGMAAGGAFWLKSVGRAQPE